LDSFSVSTMASSLILVTLYLRCVLESFWLKNAIGVVHANVDQNVTPHNPSLGLFLYHFFTYNGLVMSRVHPQQHKQPTNTTTMVMELLAPPAVWIQWNHAARAAGGLAHSFFEAAVEEFS
jgi:hypothetical protein